MTRPAGTPVHNRRQGSPEQRIIDTREQIASRTGVGQPSLQVARRDPTSVIIPRLTHGPQTAEEMQTMHRKTIGALVTGGALAALWTGSALAGPVNGATYVGRLPSYGTATFRHLKLPLHAHGASLVLTVARNGRTVTARFNTSYPIIYCIDNEHLKVQSTKPARISGSGNFTAVITGRFLPQGGAPAITQTITGHFSGRHVSGTITTTAGGCSGAAQYSASA
jgi:hypothetical protein